MFQDLILNENFKTLIRFGLVGSVNLVIDFSLFSLLFHYSNHLVLSNTCSFVVVLCIAFLLHHKYSFKNAFFEKKQIVKFLIIVIIGLIIGNILLHLIYQQLENVYFVNMAGFKDESAFLMEVSEEQARAMVSKIIQIGLMATYSFFCYKKIVFVNYQK